MPAQTMIACDSCSATATLPDGEPMPADWLALHAQHRGIWHGEPFYCCPDCLAKLGKPGEAAPALSGYLQEALSRGRDDNPA